MHDKETNRASDSLSDEEVWLLWDQYYAPLKQSIAQRVSEIRRSVANESEIALSAFNSFVARARAGEFPDLHNHNAHWKLLRTIAIRKANDLHRQLWAQRRGGAIGAASLNEQNDLVASGARAEANVEAEELLTTLLQRLPDETDRQVILLKLEGCGNANIATRLRISLRSVQRILQRIHENWTELVDD